ncbi:DUF4214 domain-containing protein [Massilia forsythiae]|uniref:DUF4214 domain-containing protein n=1 Tax=Massilia forsythiae TaxID=2728020 RepID=A0A7Z2VXI5_9BURK|nr:DUF4214 domain-containing protein [Massilia forsythiae]QJE00710.1 DUF4214 domain-containing protein [Massilia forsythiae]
MATTYYENIQKLYVAYFNRPADPSGLAYWETVVEAQKGSTTAVSATFAASAEYKAAYANMSNADIVNKVYQNLFGRAAEAEGKAYWANLLDTKKLTVDQVVTAIAGGAQTSDLTAYNNKVKAAIAFTSAIDTTAEITGYSGDAANAVSKIFISSVTTDASLATAVTTANLNATVARAVAAGSPFSLTSGLTVLDTANAAKTAFLVTADGDTDATTSATDISIAAAVTTAITGVDALVAGDYTGSTVGVRAALLADQQAANSTKLTADQKALTDANTNIAKVAGLSAAMATLDASNTAVTNATTADKAAMVDLAAKLAAYNTQNGVAVTVAADGTVAGLITINADTKALQLASGVTEAKYPGITALLTSSTSMEAADATLANAQKAQVAAQTAVDRLDLTAAAQADLKDIAAAMTVVKLDTGATPTQAQITTELTQLDAVRKSTADIAAQSGATDAQKAAATAAAAAYDKFNTLVNKMIADDDANPLVAAQTSATATVKADNDAIAALTKATATLDSANATAAQLASLNGQVKAAQDAFTSHDMLLPVTLATGTTVATAGSDIYVAGKVDATILNFNLLGTDSLYVGSQYTLNTGKLTTGNNAILEAFVAQSGSDTTIKLEKSVFGSNTATPEVVTITLTGVDATKVHLTNGIITVS